MSYTYKQVRLRSGNEATIVLPISGSSLDVTTTQPASSDDIREIYETRCFFKTTLTPGEEPKKKSEASENIIFLVFLYGVYSLGCTIWGWL